MHRLTRRNVLGGAATVAALQVLPAPTLAAAAADPVMGRLSAYMSAARDGPLPSEAVEKARHHILDTLAAMISGSTLPPGQAAIRFAREYGGARSATVAASALACGPIEAALANGVLAHADETDDSHSSLWHPGCAVVPAALACGERFGIGGAQFLRAVALGYDLGSRVLNALRPGVFETHKSTHAIGGTFGAAAAAGCAAGLDPQQMRWLLDYTAQQSSGLQALVRDKDHIEKAFVFGGMPARNGVTAALLVRTGWTGIDDIFSGEHNFLLANAPHSDPALLIDGLGERFEIARTNIKRWSVGSPIQGALAALETMMRKRPFDAGQVGEVAVNMDPVGASVVNDREMPEICLQHMIAVLLVDGSVSFRSSHDRGRMRDPAILRQRAKVRLSGGPETPAVTVTLADGTRLREQFAPVLGTTRNPMSRDQLLAKCRDLIEPVLGPRRSERLIAAIWTLEGMASIRQLGSLLRAPRA